MGLCQKRYLKKSFASEDKQVHSPNINNESSFVKFTLNFFLCELFISVFFVLTNWKKASNTFHISLLIFIRITHTVYIQSDKSKSLYFLFSVHLLYHLSHGINGKLLLIIYNYSLSYKYIFLEKYLSFLFWKIIP